MKMEPIVSSETSAIRTQTPGNYPKRNKLQEVWSSLRVLRNETHIDSVQNTSKWNECSEILGFSFVKYMYRVFRILHNKEHFRRNNYASQWRIYSELRGSKCAAKLGHIPAFCCVVQGRIYFDFKVWNFQIT